MFLFMLRSCSGGFFFSIFFWEIFLRSYVNTNRMSVNAFLQFCFVDHEFGCSLSTLRKKKIDGMLFEL